MCASSSCIAYDLTTAASIMCVAHCPPLWAPWLYDGRGAARHERPTESSTCKADKELGKIGWALRSLRPAYLLLLHVVLTFVVSLLKHVYEAMPPYPRHLRQSTAGHGVRAQADPLRPAPWAAGTAMNEPP